MTRRARRQFTQAFKDEAVTLVQKSGKTLPQVARDLDLTESALRNWVERAQPRGAGTNVSDAEQQELQQLRKEVRVLRMERDLLKKWAAFFAKEQA
jgi:transposase